MAYNRNLYSSDTDALDAGIIYDQNELMMQDEVNAAFKNGDLIVGQADNLASKMNQFSTGEFVERTTGGDASLSDGDGHLVLIRGNMIHEGYIAKSVNMTVTPIERDPSAGELTATIDNDVFLAEMESTSGTMVFTYESNGWDNDPSDYGITVIGMALPGDEISVTYQKEVRGTITQSDPQTFVSTGWNLYDHSKGYARALYYNDNPRFGITGTYTSVQYSLTITGSKSSVTPDANGTFGIPTDGNGGYIWVNGGNDTDTAVWMCWTDWTNDQTGKEPNGGAWEAYSESEIDLFTIMATYFVNGLMAVGSYHDEIDLSLGKVTANVGKMTYSDENLDDVIAMGVEYDYDNSYIYYGLTEPIISQISIDNTYAAYDHGIEFFTGTVVPIYTQTLYGVNLKNRLERDVVTISQQTLSASEQAQVATNIGAVKKTGDTMTGNLYINEGQVVIKNNDYASEDTPSPSSYRWYYLLDKNDQEIGYVASVISSTQSGLQLRGYSYATGSPVYNQLGLYVDKEGNRSISINDPTAWRSALSIKDHISFVDNDVDVTVRPSGTKTNTYVGFLDKNSKIFGRIREYCSTSGSVGVQNIVQRDVVNATTGKLETKQNYFILSVQEDGSPTVLFSNPEAWLYGLGHDAVFNLKVGTQIPNGSDLNNFTTSGTFYSASASNSATMTNTPVTGAGFKLVVMSKGSGANLSQFVFSNGATFNTYIRYYYSGSWGDWARVPILNPTNGTLSLAEGGTGKTTAPEAINALGGRTIIKTNVTSATTKTITFSNATACVIFASGNNAAARCGMYVVYCNSASSTPIIREVAAASALTLAASAGKIVASSSTTIYLDVMALQDNTWASRITIS